MSKAESKTGGASAVGTKNDDDDDDAKAESKPVSPNKAKAEAKTDDDDVLVAAEAHHRTEVPEGNRLVHRLVEYAYRVLHTEMDTFFKDNCDKFDQDWDEVRQKGETLEQFEIFKEYEKVMSKHLDKFAVNEGYSDTKKCFDVINSSVTEDLLKHKEQMKKLTEQIKKAQKQWAKQSKKLMRAHEKAKKKQEAKGSGDGDEGKDDGDEEEEETEEEATSSDEDEKDDGKKAPPPMVLFFQPITLEELVNMVLNLAEYPTFSMMMRMKAQQIKVRNRMPLPLAPLPSYQLTRISLFLQWMKAWEKQHKELMAQHQAEAKDSGSGAGAGAKGSSSSGDGAKKDKKGDDDENFDVEGEMDALLEELGSEPLG
jgi:hypothetical protein